MFLSSKHRVWCISGSSDPAVLAQTSSVESKRQNYIHELINTEETYMADMSIVLDVSIPLQNNFFVTFPSSYPPPSPHLKKINTHPHFKQEI